MAVATLAFALGWQIKEIAVFPKEFLARSDISAIRTLLGEKDQHRFVLTNAMGAAFLYYWNRYPLDVAQFGPEHIPRYVLALQDQFGNEPIRLVHLSNVEKIDFDKYVYGAFAGQKRWDWIANPGPHRSEWQPIVRAKDDALVAYVSQFGELELDTGTAQVWKIERQRLMDFLAKQVMTTPTTSIDFGTMAAEKFKAGGFRYPEQPWGPDKPGAVWTERRTPSRIIFTLQGLRHIPTGAPPRDDSTVRLDMPPGRPYRIEIGMASAVDAQHVSVSLNGSSKLAELTLDKAAELHDFAIDVPPEALDASGLQVLRLDIGRVNAEGLGVSLGHFQIMPR